MLVDDDEIMRVSSHHSFQDQPFSTHPRLYRTILVIVISKVTHVYATLDIGWAYLFEFLLHLFERRRPFIGNSEAYILRNACFEMEGAMTSRRRRRHEASKEPSQNPLK